jgi:ubiquitin C-terminal hydrolase
MPKESQLVPLCPSSLPKPFGLNNTGVICYINSLLQALASCTSFTDAILQNPKYYARTGTGSALLSFLRAARPAASVRGTPDVTSHSSRVLQALTADVRARRPRDRSFGGGQESASEGLAFLLEMILPPEDLIYESPAHLVLYHRQRYWTKCETCQKLWPNGQQDHHTFPLVTVRPPTNATDFVNDLVLELSEIDPAAPYKCADCVGAGRPPQPATRETHLTLVPEVFICQLTSAYVNNRATPWFPPTITFDGSNGRKLKYEVVATVDHVGRLTGGHYTARVLRSKGAGVEVYRTNDSSVQPGAAFAPDKTSYLVFYHAV